MSFTQNNIEQQFQNIIRHIWCDLTDEEIACHETMRDIFFLAVRKKYGVPRAQAEDILRHTQYSVEANAA